MKKGKKKSDTFTNIVSGAAAQEQNATLGQATDTTIKAADNLIWKAEHLKNVGFEQGKGNLFEYIEALKLHRNNARAGNPDYDRSVVTDLPKSRGGYGGHDAPDDFRLEQDGQVVGRGQAKVNNNPDHTAHNFSQQKYEGMERITTSDTYEQVKEALDKKLSNGTIGKEQYDDVMANIRKGLTDDRTGISSGGTTTAELEQFRGADGKVDTDAVIRYANRIKYTEMAREVGGAATKGAAAGFVMGTLISGIENACAVYRGEKSGQEAFKATLKEGAQASLKGGATGAVSAGIRIAAKANGYTVLSNSGASVPMAACVIDCGVSVYSYFKGEISKEQLAEEIGMSMVKTSVSFCFTTGLQAAGVVASGSVFAPMAIYAATSYLLMASKSIIDNAKLEAEEYKRATELIEAECLQISKYRQQLQEEMQKYRDERKATMDKFLDTFENAIFTSVDYNQAIESLSNFADEWHITLQHKDFKDFHEAVVKQEVFVL